MPVTVTGIKLPIRLNHTHLVSLKNNLFLIFLSFFVLQFKNLSSSFMGLSTAGKGTLKKIEMEDR